MAHGLKNGQYRYRDTGTKSTGKSGSSVPGCYLCSVQEVLAFVHMPYAQIVILNADF